VSPGLPVPDGQASPVAGVVGNVSTIESLVVDLSSSVVNSEDSVQSLATSFSDDSPDGDSAVASDSVKIRVDSDSDVMVSGVLGPAPSHPRDDFSPVPSPVVVSSVEESLSAVLNSDELPDLSSFSESESVESEFSVSVNTSNSDESSNDGSSENDTGPFSAEMEVDSETSSEFLDIEVNFSSMLDHSSEDKSSEEFHIDQAESFFSESSDVESEGSSFDRINPRLVLDDLWRDRLDVDGLFNQSGGDDLQVAGTKSDSHGFCHS